MVRLNEFVPIAPNLNPSKHFTLTGFLINSNGISDTKVTSDDITLTNRKTSIISEAAHHYGWDVIHITETHETPVEDTELRQWHCIESLKTGVKKHGTLTATNREIADGAITQNVTAALIKIEEESMWFVTAYFPNDEQGTKETISNLERVLRKTKGRRVILAGDFNSTETFSKLDCGGAKTPTTHRAKRADLIEDLTRKWRLRDIWTDPTNVKKGSDMEACNHITHWNTERTRGVRIDRIYANFYSSLRLEVRTLDLAISDHAGVEYKFSSTPNTNHAGSHKRALPHRAFKLPEVTEMVKTELNKFLELNLDSSDTLQEWDNTKDRIRRKAENLWEDMTKRRKRRVVKNEKKYKRAKKRLASLQENAPSRDKTLAWMNKRKFKLQKNREEDKDQKEEAKKRNWCSKSGKPNKEFLRKPKSATKKITNMTIDNTKDRPDLPRTDDPEIISDNFVKYYGELYEKKHVSPSVLERLIKNLDVKLDEEDREELGHSPDVPELVKAIAHSPDNKSPGPDRIPYEAYKAAPNEAAAAIARIGAIVSDRAITPKSWKEINITVLPKEEDSYSTHKFRPISLINCDYKLLTREWADRIGPILNKKIGHHQRGFIPGRDGRENVLNVQLNIDYINATDGEGAMIFLDQEKAFDRVSFQTIRTIFKELRWPTAFTNLIEATYSEDLIKARIKINGSLSPGRVNINSGTRQGCPLSPLIYAIVADLFNAAIIKHPEFTGHKLGEIATNKISAYADDTVVHIGTLKDLKIMKTKLREYTEATGGKTNMDKSEIIRLGRWKDKDLDINMKFTKSAKYLGVQTGTCQETARRAIELRTAKVLDRLKYWDNRLSSSPVDRNMVAKIMCESVVWYHATLMPGWDDSLDKIEKLTNQMVWKNGIHKVAKATITQDKKEGGIKFWILNAKAAAFRNMWIIKRLADKLNPLLASTFAAIESLYADRAGTTIPLWQSKIDHSQNIIQHINSPLLATLQRDWAYVVRRDPVLDKGTWVSYDAAEVNTRTKHADRLYEGYGRVKNITEEWIVTNWYQWNDTKGRYSKLPPPDGERYWHLQPNKTYSITNRRYKTKQFEVPTSTSDLYIRYRGGSATIKEIAEEKPTEMELDRNSPKIPKEEANSKLYKAQKFRRIKEKSKENKWVTEYDINLGETLNKYTKAYYDSPTKGFMWLFVSHALPVGSRHRGKDCEPSCPRCGELETIKHMAFSCEWATKVRKAVYTEWWGRTGEAELAVRDDFHTAFFFKELDPVKEEIRNTITGITTRNIWKAACAHRYSKEAPPLPIIAANNIWAEIERALLAQASHLVKRIEWWNYRELIQAVNTELAQEKTESIQGEIHNLVRLVPKERRPKSLKKLVIPEIVHQDIQEDGFISFNPPRPTTTTHHSYHWKMTTVPQPERFEYLDTRSESEADVETSRSSSSESGL